MLSYVFSKNFGKYASKTIFLIKKTNKQKHYQGCLGFFTQRLKNKTAQECTSENLFRFKHNGLVY